MTIIHEIRKKFRPTKLYVLYETFQITGKALGTGITIIVIARFFYLCPPQNNCLNLSSLLWWQ